MYLPKWLAIWNLQIAIRFLGTWLFACPYLDLCERGQQQKALVNVKNFHQLASCRGSTKTFAGADSLQLP